MNCPYCSREIQPEMKFCPGCGATLGAGKSGVPTPPPQAAAPAPEFKLHTTPQDRPSFNLRTEPDEIDLAEAKRKRFIFAGVTGIVAMAFIAAYIVYMATRPAPPSKSFSVPKASAEIDKNKPAAENKKQGGMAPVKKSELTKAEKKVLASIEQFWKDDININYFRVYMRMTPSMHTRLHSWYDRINVSNSAGYSEMRRAGEYEPKIKSAKLVGAIYVKGGRAEATGMIEGTFQGSPIKWCYNYVLLHSGEDWLVDSMAAGPDCPYNKSKFADLDGDEENEEVILTGDYIHRVLRWEVVEPDGSQAYVMELAACPGRNDRSPAGDAAFTKLAEGQPKIVRFGDAEAEALRDNFPAWADSIDIKTARLERRKLFTMDDGCSDVTYRVMNVKEQYVEFVMPRVAPEVEKPAEPAPAPKPVVKKKKSK